MPINKIKTFCERILKLANRDFYPGLNRYVHWFKQPIGWVSLAIIFSLLVGMLIGPQGFIMAAAFTSLLAVGLVWPWLSVMGVSCTLILPNERLIENEILDIVFKVRNRWPFPVFGLMIKGDFLQELDPDEEPVVFSLRWVPGWTDTEFRIPVVASRRGKLPDGEILVSNGFPFGLYEFASTIVVPKRAIVWPANNSLIDSLNTTAATRSLKGIVCDRPGHVNDSIGIRPYQQGDRLKNIHWAQSARSQSLMVRERQSFASTKASVILDLSPNVHAGIGTQSSFEQSIRIAASICWQLQASHADIQLFTIGLSPNRCRSTNNRSGIDTIMESLACLPTLPQVKLSVGAGQSLGNPSLVVQDSTFFVGTNKSTSHKVFTAAIKKFLIDLDSSPQYQLGCDNQTISPLIDQASPAAALPSDPIDGIAQGSYSYAAS